MKVGNLLKEDCEKVSFIFYHLQLVTNSCGLQVLKNSLLWMFSMEVSFISFS